MTSTTVLAYIQRSVVVFEIFGEEVRKGGLCLAELCAGCEVLPDLHDLGASGQPM
jgi:hypothetical protein